MTRKPSDTSGTVERVGGPAKGPGRGGPATGYKWPPFEKGNTAALRHGSYASALTLAPRPEEIAERLRAAMGERFEEQHGPAIEAVALAGARVERAMTVLLADLPDEAEPLTHEEFIARLSQDARSWLRTYLEGLTRLGLTPEAGTPAVSVQVGVVTIEQDAATQARLFAKLRAIGLVARDVVDVEAVEVRELGTVPPPEEAKESRLPYGDTPGVSRPAGDAP